MHPNTEPIPPVQGGLSESVRRLCSLSNAELATRDIAELNLSVARGLPGTEGLDIGSCLEKLNAWANLVSLNTEHWWPSFVRSPEQCDNSPCQFRMMCLVTVLQRDLGVRYNLAFNEGEYDGTDSRNLFLHGLLSGHGGTCVTMPILYAAVGRRLGYPLKIVHAKEHAFVRWEEPDGERFNIEATSEGFCPHDDAYYHERPLPLTAEELGTGFYLRSLSPREELAFFLANRGTCLTEHLLTRSAMESLHFAKELCPESPTYRGQWGTAAVLGGMIERLAKAASCSHADIVAMLRLKAFRNELSCDDLPFPKHLVSSEERWALARSASYLRRVLENDVRRRRQTEQSRQTDSQGHVSPTIQAVATARCPSQEGLRGTLHLPPGSRSRSMGQSLLRIPP